MNDTIFYVLSYCATIRLCCVAPLYPLFALLPIALILINNIRFR